MTTEEAIKHFESQAQCGYAPTSEAAKMAISALTERCRAGRMDFVNEGKGEQKMERLIDAGKLKAVLQNIKEHLEESGNPQSVGMAAVFAHVMEIVDAQPDIDPPNDPLTLDELWEMDGEPVWVISPDGRYGPCWMLVNLKYMCCREANGGIVVSETYGETWLAYRRKPEEV